MKWKNRRRILCNFPKQEKTERRIEMRKVAKQGLGMDEDEETRPSNLWNSVIIYPVEAMGQKDMKLSSILCGLRNFKIYLLF